MADWQLLRKKVKTKKADIYGYASAIVEKLKLPQEIVCRRGALNLAVVWTGKTA